MLYNLASYVFRGEFHTGKKSVKSWVLSCMPIIESAKERYETCQENGRLGGRPQTIDRETVFRLSDEGKSAREIAEIVGCSARSIQRFITDLRQNDKSPTKARQNHNVNVNDNVNDNVKDNDNVKTPLKGGVGGKNEIAIAVANADGVSDTKQTEKVKTVYFTPPTVDEVRAYCKERGNTVDPECFWDFYASKGWMVGKNRMKDWRACVRTWERSSRTDKNRPTDNTATDNIFAQIYDEEHRL